ncbi:MAG TPA: 2-C-methyl-D-erythritol 2,4-cyclodiphosphate synthase [Thermodesulfobacteriota bacterium]|nr:2-C-methyl-D-erythritol 2,4-cyclodiphosphate synthase [Thermodesulfobacteriota bacterium]
MYRVGIGFDAHRFSRGRKLVLGGVEIPFEFGLAGHSDADVLTHAICDAALGAIGERDIGSHFPDSDPKYKGVSSLILLEEVIALSNSKGFKIENIDSVVVCESPRLGEYVSQIKKNIAAVAGISEESLGVKATTTDKMGFTGRGEGIAAYAVVLMKKVTV